MQFNEYLEHARLTRSPHNTRAITMMGLFGESGEVVDLIKKVVGHGHEITPELRAKMCREIGDVLWYWAIGTDDDVASWDEEGTPNFDETSSQMIVEKPRRTLTNLALALRVSVHSIEFTDGRPHNIYAETLRVLASIAAHFELTLSDVAVANVEKLKQRYAAGFSTEASVARVDVKEEAPISSQMAKALRANIDACVLNAPTEAERRQARCFQLLAMGFSDYEARQMAADDVDIARDEKTEEVQNLERALEIAGDIANGGPHRAIDLDPPERL